MVQTYSTKKRTHVFISAAVLLLLSISILAFVVLRFSSTTSAANKNDWITNNIISDAEFTNVNSMSVSDIQAFLDKSIGTCDTWGTGEATEYYYTGYRGTRAGYAALKGWSGPPYTCLNIYYEVPKTTAGGDMPANNYSNPSSRPTGSQSAAWIIKDAAIRYNLNPKVLLVKIATESAGPLTSDKWPLLSQYRYAMGSHCPDSGVNNSANCDPAYAGFSIQMYSAAALMRSYLDNMDKSWWTYKVPGTGKVTIDANGNQVNSNWVGWNVPARGCGGTTLNIQNKATAALYTYTPYQPNQAALNNMYGTGDNCSAYGNRNFWRVYWDWFGNTRGYSILPELADRYNALGGANGALGSTTDSGYCTPDKSACWQSFTNGTIIWSPATGAWESKGSIRERWAALGYQTGSLGFPIGPEVWDGKGWWQNYQGGAIIGTATTGYWESRGAIRERWDQLGWQAGVMGYPTTNVSCNLKDGGCYQNYENGAIVGTSRTGYWESRGAIRERWKSLRYENGALGYPLTNEVCAQKDNGCSQQYQSGLISWSSKTSAFESTGSILSKWQEFKEEDGKFGYPTTGIVCGIKGGGCYQNYENGAIVWQPGNGAWESYGGIRDRWQATGWENGTLGYPTTDIVCGIKGGGCYQNYENGAIVWQPGNGAWESYGGIRDRWQATGWENGTLGYPTSKVYCSLIRSGCYQNYEKAVVVGSPSTGYWETYGSIRSKWAKAGYENGAYGYPAGPVIKDKDGIASQKFQYGTIKE